MEKKSNSKSKTYEIHDNYGRPFKVKIYSDHIKIYELDHESKKTKYLPFMGISEYEKVFIGKSPLNEMTEFSGGHGSDFDGNTILIKLSAHEYIFVGGKICQFKTADEIVEYMSHVGNSDVPYPYAVGKNKTYLMIEDVYLNNKDIDFEKDVYTQYYANDAKLKSYEFKSTVLHKRIE